jgi:hypothetical protein
MAIHFKKKGMCENLQIVCSIDDLRQLFTEWRDEQRENERQGREQQTKQDEYKTTKEVCKMLGVTKPTLWRWAQIKYLVPVKVGRKNYYRVADIEALRKR